MQEDRIDIRYEQLRYETAVFIQIIARDGGGPQRSAANLMNVLYSSSHGHEWTQDP